MVSLYAHSSGRTVPCHDRMVVPCDAGAMRYPRLMVALPALDRVNGQQWLQVSLNRTLYDMDDMVIAAAFRGLAIRRPGESRSDGQVK